MRRFWFFALALLLFGITGAVATPAAQAVAYPGGKRIYAVTLGSMPAKDATSYSTVPFSRLAMYYFFGDGTVNESFWYWSWNNAYPAVNTAVKSTGCDNCTEHTSSGFTVAAKSLSGTYTNDGSNVTITWTGGLTESWSVASPTGKLSAMSLTGSSYGANVGQAYGSNVTSSTAVPISQVPLHAYVGRYASWGQDTKSPTGFRAGGGTSGLDLSPFARCNGNCLSAKLPASENACTKCASGQPGTIRYYLGSDGGRKNYYEHFCNCLTTGQCYGGGSHLKPQLQVIDDDGTLHGWVGIEASNRTVHGGTLGVHWHVDV